MGNSAPPKLFSKLLQWLCVPELLEELEGDLEESFQYYITQKGRWYARYKYAKEVVFLMRPSVIRKINNNSNSIFMISNYGKVAFRNFSKNKNYVIINVLSMSIGLACCIVSYLNYEHNSSFDSQHENITNIYRINYQEQDSDELRTYGVVPLPISRESGNLTQVTDIIQYTEWHGSAKIANDYFEINAGYVSSNFLDHFTFPLIRGSKEVLANRESIIISNKLALRLYDDINVIGLPLVFSHKGNEHTYIIEGILEDFPSNTSFNIDALINRENLALDHPTNDWQNFVTSFLLVDNVPSLPSIIASINNFADANHPIGQDMPKKIYHLDPLVGMANRAQANDVIGPLEESLPWAIEVVPAIISLMILLIACFTFTNTTIASAATRLKEIGIRKVLGGRKNQIAFQFIIESIMVCILAILLAIPLTKLLAAQYNQLMPFLELELIFSNNIGFFSFLIVLVLLAGLMAGSYPALYLSKFQPSKILKGNLKYKSVGRITKSLLTAQFAFAMMTITASVLFVQNAKYQNATDLGFDTDQTIVVRIGNEEDKEQVYHAMHNALVMNPKITHLTGASDHVARKYHQATVFYEGETLDIVGLDVGPGYIETIELNLTEGRDFKEEKASDYIENIIINKLFVKQMGWTDPIGKKLTYQDSIEYFVIGVVEDFHFDDFSSPIQPLWLRLAKPEEYNYLIAKTDKENIESVMAEITMAWQTLFNNEITDIKAPEYPRYKGQIINGIILKVLVFMGSVAAIMSMIGFFSLVSLNIFGRMKEIGVRRVLGSSTTSIIQVINKDYIVILLVGITSGSIASHFLIPMLMNSLWAYHSDGSLMLTILSILIMLVTCMFTVGLRVVNAARTNPTELLKDE